MIKDRMAKMQTLSEHRLFDEAPLYVRWHAERPSIAIELRLDLIGKIAKEIDEAEKSSTETGGILLGTPPNAVTPTLRIDSFEIIRRRAEDGPLFMLDPKEHDRFLTTRWDDKIKGRNVVGLFRTHLRSGPLRPSLADRTLLASAFGEQLHFLMLIENAHPRSTGNFTWNSHDARGGAFCSRI